jgi:hypothetical protein
MAEKREIEEQHERYERPTVIERQTVVGLLGEVPSDCDFDFSGTF